MRPASTPLGLLTWVHTAVASALVLLGAVAGSAPAAYAAEDVGDAGDRFVVTGTGSLSLRVHSSPGLDAPIVARLAEGAVVILDDDPAVEEDGERWLQIKTARVQGWAAARYLVRETALTATPRSLPSGAALGERAAAFAESVVGRPYVWGGTSTSGFDCSGLVQWVYKQVGRDLPRTVATQIGVGRKIAVADLADGDLVFFENTYRPGLSHVGVYVGEGRFVHAADEARGVIVSKLATTYWKQRFYAATRPLS